MENSEERGEKPTDRYPDNYHQEDKSQCLIFHPSLFELPLLSTLRSSLVLISALASFTVNTHNCVFTD